MNEKDSPWNYTKWLFFGATPFFVRRALGKRHKSCMRLYLIKWVVQHDAAQNMEAGNLIAMLDSIIECLPPSQLRCTGRSKPTSFA